MLARKPMTIENTPAVETTSRVRHSIRASFLQMAHAAASGPGGFTPPSLDDSVPERAHLALRRHVADLVRGDLALLGGEDREDLLRDGGEVLGALRRLARVDRVREALRVE